MELLYRERFGLSWSQMQDEPAEAVELWIALEAARHHAQEPVKPGQTRSVGEPLEPEDM